MVEKDHVATDYNDMGEYNIFFIMERRLKWNIIKSCYQEINGCPNGLRTARGTKKMGFFLVDKAIQEKDGVADDKTSIEDLNGFILW